MHVYMNHCEELEVKCDSGVVVNYCPTIGDFQIFGSEDKNSVVILGEDMNDLIEAIALIRKSEKR